MTLHLDAGSARMDPEAVEVEASTSYRASRREPVSFVHVFDRDTEIAGWMLLTLHLSVVDDSDSDVFIEMRKRSQGGAELPILVHGAPYSARSGSTYQWGNGQLRLSHRAVAEYRDGLPLRTHTDSQALRAGDIVRAEIEIPPIAIRFRHGEQLEVLVSGVCPQTPELPIQPPHRSRNRGAVTIHTGGPYQSTLTLPVRLLSRGAG